MKNILITAFCLLCISTLNAQKSPDTIAIRQSLGVVFKYKGKVQKPRQLLALTSSNDEAYAAMKKAKGNFDVGAVFASAGGFLVGWPLGTAIGGGDPNWALAGIGAGLIVISLPFSSAYGKHAKNAVRIYNADAKMSDNDDYQMEMGITQNGFTMKWQF